MKYIVFHLHHKINKKNRWDSGKPCPLQTPSGDINMVVILLLANTVKPVFKTTWEIGTTLELRTATSVPRPIQHIEMDLKNKTTSDFRTVLDSPLGVPNSKVPLYICSMQISYYWKSEWPWLWALKVSPCQIWQCHWTRHIGFPINS